MQGLRRAVFTAVSYGFAMLATPGGQPQPIPAELLVQAREAARHGVSLDTVLRRYFAGYTLLGDFLMREADSQRLGGKLDLHRLAKSQAVVFDRLVEAIATEYRRAAAEQARRFSRRRTDCVERLLAGELVDDAQLGYELEAWHVALVAAGEGAEQALRALAKAADRRLLVVRRADGLAWAWLGGQRRLGAGELTALAANQELGGLSLAVGEPGKGMGGWRLSHHQALAALPIALRSPQPLTRYGEVALLASMLQDEVLTRSLNDLYLAPLGEEDRDGKVLRQTLNAYFVANHNVSSAAAALGVNRHTVTNRLRMIEERIGRPLNTCAIEIEAALRLEEKLPPTRLGGDGPNQLKPYRLIALDKMAD